MYRYLLLLTWIFLIHSHHCNAQDTSIIHLPGLQHSVSINKDQWGISHIYASSEQDLFFAQGYNAAKDRLFQFEMFRRQATGTTAEILGEREFSRDYGARLFKFRGDLQKEMIHYHPRGDIIIKSFVLGINAYIKLVLSGTEKLPFEFQKLGIKPQFWTPEIVISRHNGLLGNVQEELNTARAVLQIGSTRVLNLKNYHPHQPNLDLDPLITKEALKEDILKWYNAYRKPILFEQNDLIGSIQNETGIKGLNLSLYSQVAYSTSNSYEGSNNWVIHGTKSQSGMPMLANDPHRAITIPSLRYITHLQAPGWNVIGGGEPILPGISIGHNEYGAWGLTIFETDIEDLYVYKLNPKNKNQYWYRDTWLTFTSIKDNIKIKNSKTRPVLFYYTKQGPVTYIDTVRHLVYAVRCGWLEQGCAPYLASLRMDQSKSWEEFKQACTYSYVPAENMIWADKKNNIGWQTVGLAPIRPNHSGMVPVVYDRKNEWAGYLPILKRPSEYNPKAGFLSTANENLTPSNYPNMNSIGYSWADAYRGDRIRQVLNDKNNMTIVDFELLQTDYVSLPARQLIPMIRSLQLNDPELESYQKYLNTWNQSLDAVSGQAGLYEFFERYLEEHLLKVFIPENYDDKTGNNVSITSLSTAWMVRYLEGSPDKNKFILTAFIQAAHKMEFLFGKNRNTWRYGDTIFFKHAFMQHTLSKIVSQSDRKKINTPKAPRGGNGNTVGSTGSNDNQSSGASFRLIIDCADWDQAKAINVPGQSGDPDNKHYKDLFELWSRDKYFPLYYSKKKINEVTEHVSILKP